MIWSPAAVAAALTGVQVGAAVVASRAAVDDLGPTTLALFRYAIGAAMLVPVALRLGWERMVLRDALVVSVLGIGQFAVLVALLNLSVTYIPSGRAAVILATMPVQTILVAAILGRERLTLRRLAGTVVTTAGVAAALHQTVHLDATGEEVWIGVAAAGASAFVGAVCSVLYRPFLVRYPTVQLSALAMTASVVFLAAIVWADPPPLGWDGLAAAPWGIVAFIGASSGIGYFLWLYALREMAATDVTLFLALSPITAAGLGALFLGESLGPGLFAGLALVVGGMWLVLAAPATSCPGVPARSNCADQKAREETP